jgi:Holliday junction resolvasome RuvABC DNA-binding subunit
MREKRQEAERRRAQKKAGANAQTRVAAEDAKDRDVIPWLRELGYNAARARKGADACAHIPDAPLEERVKVALRALAPHCVRWAPHVASGPA